MKLGHYWGIVFTILGIAAVVFGFYLFLKPLPPNFFPPVDFRMMADDSLWVLTFFGFPLIALGITLLLLDEGKSLFASILAVIGSLSLSVAIHQVLIYAIIQWTPPLSLLLFMGTADVLAFIVLGLLLLAASIFLDSKTRNLHAKCSQSVYG